MVELNCSCFCHISSVVMMYFEGGAIVFMYCIWVLCFIASLELVVLHVSVHSYVVHQFCSVIVLLFLFGYTWLDLIVVNALYIRALYKN